MLVEVIPILQSNLCMFPNTTHFVGRGYPHLTVQTLYVSQHFPLCWTRYSNLTEQPLYVSQQFPLCWSRLSPSFSVSSVCFSTLPIMLVEGIPTLHNNLCLFPNTSHYVYRDPNPTQQPMYVIKHIPLCWSSLSPSYRAISVCCPTPPPPLCWSR